MNSRSKLSAFFLALARAACSSACHQTTVLATDSAIPTATVKEVDLQLKVSTTGVLRTSESRTISAPAIGGGTLQIVTLARSGAQVHTGDVVLEFDPSQQEYNLGQNRSDLLQAEQEIVKAKADADVQTAEDHTALLKARYALRRAELEVSKNELVSPIDAQKNLLALDEAKRALTQLQQDIQSHSASNQAALAISEEKRHKARLSMEQAEQNIKNMHVTAPIDGLVVIHGNRDSTGGFFMYGMTLPDYHVGDQANPGSSIAEVIDISHLEVAAQVGETDRTNLKAGAVGFAYLRSDFQVRDVDDFRDGTSRIGLVADVIVRERHPIHEKSTRRIPVSVNDHETVNRCGDVHVLDVLFRLLHGESSLVTFLFANGKCSLI